MINICKFPRKSCNRKSYHIEVVAVNFPDKKRTAVLNAVCSGLVHGITLPDVIIYKSFLEIIIAVELNKTLFSKALRAGAADKGNTRCDRMPPSRQTFEHMRSISLIFRLAVNYIVQYYRSIRPYNDSFSTGLPRKQIIYRLRFRQRSEEHTSELQSPDHIVCRLLVEKKRDIAARMPAGEKSRSSEKKTVATDRA